MTKIPEDFKEKYSSYLNGELTLGGLCSTYGTYAKQIYRWRDKLGLSQKHQSLDESYRENTNRLPKKEFLQDYGNYLLDKMSMRDLATKYNFMSSGSLYHYIRKWNLPRKSELLQPPKTDSNIKTYSIGDYHITVKFEKFKR